MSLIASEEFKIGLPELGFNAWHSCEEVVLLFWHME
jgi:hypothetical protein